LLEMYKQRAEILEEGRRRRSDSPHLHTTEEIRARHREIVYGRVAEIETHINRLKKGNNAVETAKHMSRRQQEIDQLRELQKELIQRIGLFDPRPPKRTGVLIVLKVKSLEVYGGVAISQFALKNTDMDVAGAPDIGRCDAGQDMHFNLDRTFHDRPKPVPGLYKSGDKPNPLSGYPWHSCSHYKSLKGQRVILLGKGSEVLCTDGIIEIEALTNPELLREFLRCAGPAVERAGTQKFGDMKQSLMKSCLDPLSVN